MVTFRVLAQISNTCSAWNNRRSSVTVQRDFTCRQDSFSACHNDQQVLKCNDQECSVNHFHPVKFSFEHFLLAIWLHKYVNALYNNLHSLWVNNSLDELTLFCSPLTIYIFAVPSHIWIKYNRELPQGAPVRWVMDHSCFLRTFYLSFLNILQW